MLSDGQIRVAELLNGTHRHLEMAKLDFDYMVRNSLVAMWCADHYYLVCYGAIFGRYSIGASMSVFLYEQELLRTPNHSAIPMCKKTAKSLPQINIERTLWVETDPCTTWRMEANVEAAEFNIIEILEGKPVVFTNGLVLDLNNLKGVKSDKRGRTSTGN